MRLQQARKDDVRELCWLIAANLVHPNLARFDLLTQACDFPLGPEKEFACLKHLHFRSGVVEREKR